MTLWLTHHTLYEIDIKARRVERLVDVKDSTLQSMSAQAWYPIDKEEKHYVDPKVYRPLIVCRSSDNRYHLVLRDPDLSLSFAPPPEWTQWVNSHCRFTATQTDLFMTRGWIEYPPARMDILASDAYFAYAQAYNITTKYHGTELYRMDTDANLEIVSKGG